MKAELVLGNLKRERDALDNKLERLEQALNKEWQDADQEYLCTQQYHAMCLYAHILDERIVDIECKLEQKKAEKTETVSHEESHSDKSLFKDWETFKKVNSDFRKEYRENLCPEDEKTHDDTPDQIIIRIIRDIFGEDSVQ